MIEAQVLITASINGQSIGEWDTRSGGDLTTSPTLHRPAGMGPEKSYRGLPTYADLKIGRVYERARDHELYRGFLAQAGIQPMTVTRQPLDENGQSWGSPIVYTGRFKDVTFPSDDSTSEKPAMGEITMKVTQVA